MKKLSWLCLLLCLLLSQAGHTQATKPTSKVLVNERLIARFLKQAGLLRKAAVKLRFKKITEPADSFYYPAPGDKVLTYCSKGDTIIFYQSGQDFQLLSCSLLSTARYASTVPFLASSKEALFVGKYKAYNAFTIIDSAINRVYMLKLRFQENSIRRLSLDMDWSSW